MSRIETERLIIRAFRADDGPGIQELAIDKESSQGAIYDHTWPTSDEETRGMAEYFSQRDAQYFAMCQNSDGRIIGLLAFNDISEDKQMDLGHVIHTQFQDDDIDREALETIIDFAFANRDISSIVTRNRPEWTVQIAPLISLGLKRGRGGAGDLEITREAWEARTR